MKKAKTSDKVVHILTEVVVYVLCVAVAVMCLFPLFFLLINSTRSAVEIDSGLSFLPGTSLIDNIHYLQEADFSLVRAFFNSMIISVVSTALCVYFSSMTAYAFYAYDFKLKKFLTKIVMLIIIIPGQLGMLGFYKLVTEILHIYDTYVPLTIPAIASASTVFFIMQYLQANFSMDLVNAARVDSAGEFRIFNTVTVPILKPAIATMAIFGFISSWNNYMGPLLYLSDPNKFTLPMIVEQLKTNISGVPEGAIALGLLVTILPLMIIYTIFSKPIIDGVAMGGSKE